MTELTKEVLVASLPDHLQNTVTDSMVTTVNNIIDDPDVAEAYRDNVLNLNHVLNNKRLSLPKYLDAVHYVTYKQMGMTNAEAWAKVFPAKYARLVAEGKNKSTIASHVTGYVSTKLVASLMEQQTISNSILFKDLYNESLQGLMSIARDEGVSPKVRSDSYNAVLNQLKPNEKMQLDINHHNDSATNEILSDARNVIKELAAQAREKVINGEWSASDITEIEVIPKPAE